MKKLLIIAFLISFIGVMFANTSIILTEDFENTTQVNQNWTLVNGTVTNKWYLGTATSSSGTRSIYVSSTSGTTNVQDSPSSVAHFYRDVQIPVGATNIKLYFDIRIRGESSFDYVRVYSAPTTLTPAASTTSFTVTGTDPNAAHRIGADRYNLYNLPEGLWTNVEIDIPNAQAGQTRRLIFTWINDGSVQNLPPAAIDNVVMLHTASSAFPLPAVAIAPLNMTSSAYIHQDLRWKAPTGANTPTGYKVYFGDSNPPTSMNDVGNALRWTPSAMSWGTTYYWRVVPYNASGDAVNTPIWSFTTPADPTLTIPHVQSFDTAVTMPFLPAHWGKIISIGEGYTSHSLYVYNESTPHSTPNHIQMYNDGNAAAVLILRTPPINSLSTKRVKFHARTSDAGTPLHVGFLTDPTDHTTFVQIQSVPLTTTYTQYNVALTGATGSYLAFRHGNGSTDRYIYVDNVLIEGLPTGADFDCPVTSINFEAFPLSETRSVEVRVTNSGNSALEITHPSLPVGITVNAMSAGHPAISIAPAGTSTLTYTLNPTVEGVYEQIITMHTNADNAPTYSIPITTYILPPGFLEVGTGTNTTRYTVPVDLYYYHSYTQTIYPAAQLDEMAAGEIVAVRWRYYGNGSPNAQRIQIFMGHTTLNQFTADSSWVPYSSLTRVYGVQNTADPTASNHKTIPMNAQPFPAGGGWVNIALDTPFPYNGSDNLVIAVFDYGYSPSYPGSDHRWYTTDTPGVYRSSAARTDINGGITSINPPNLTPSRYEYYPNIQFSFTLPVESGAHLAFNNDAIAFGTQYIGYQMNTKTLRIRNSGDQDVTISSVATSGDIGDFTFTGIPTDGHVLEPGQFVLINVTPTSTTAGAKSAQIVVSSDASVPVTTIPISSTIVDLTITTATHTENFDALTAPSLPTGWSAIVGTGATEYNVDTYASTSRSQPNSLRLYNGGTTGVDIMATSRPVQNLRDRKMTFYVYGGGAGYTLNVGYLNASGTFQLVETITDIPGSAWSTQRTVNFGSVPTGTYRIAFKHPNTSTYNTLYIDDVVIDTRPATPEYFSTTSQLNFGAHDLNTTASQSISIANLGRADMTLYFELPTYLTVNPSAINAGSQVTIPNGGSQSFTFTLNTTGLPTGDLRGNVNIHTNAANANPHVLPLLIHIMPVAPLDGVQIGNGSTTVYSSYQGIPTAPFYQFSWSQTIYYWTDIANDRPTGGTIHTIGYEYTGAALTQDFRIYIGTTTNTVFTSATSTGFIPCSQMTLVYNGTVAIPTAVTGRNNWVWISLSTPFTWTPGTNIVVSVEEYTPNNSLTSSNTYYGQATTGQARSWVAYIDGSTPQNSHTATAAIGNIYTRQAIPNTIFGITPTPSDGQTIFIVPDNINFGTHALNNANLIAPQSIRIMNIGDSPVTIQSVAISGANRTEFTLQTDPTGTSLEPGIANAITLVVNHRPISQGPKYATINITDSTTNSPSGSAIRLVNSDDRELVAQQNTRLEQIARNSDSRMVHTVVLESNITEPVYEVIVGTATTESYIPYYPYYRNSYSQSIFTQSDLIALPDGATITTLAYEFNETSHSSPIGRQATIYMGWTNQSTFASTSNYIPIAGLTPVWTGFYPVNAGARWVSVTLTGDGFTYSPPSASSNLVIVFQTTQQPTDYNSSDNKFRTTATTGNRSIYFYSDSALFDPASPSGGTNATLAMIPNIKITYDEPGLPRPRNLSGTTDFQVVHLAWDAPTFTDPDIAEAFTGYIVYKDGQEAMGGEFTSWSDNEVWTGATYYYHVVATYEIDGEEQYSNPSNYLSLAPHGEEIAPPGNLQIRPTSTENNFVLTWQNGVFSMTENFEGTEIPTGWHNIDVDEDGNKWQISSTGGKEGAKHVYSMSRDEDGVLPYVENWLISTNFVVPAPHTYLNFWASALSAGYSNEIFRIYISPTASTEAYDESFVLVKQDTLKTHSWTRYSYDLSEWTHKESVTGARIAIVHISHASAARSQLNIDGLQVLAPTDAFVDGYIGARIFRNGAVHANYVTSQSANLTNLPNGTHEIWLSGIHGDDYNISAPGNVVRVKVEVIIIAEEEETLPPALTQLKGNYPNPFNPVTTIAFDLARESHVSIDIYNVKGQKVTTLLSEVRGAGEHRVIWSGKDSAGRDVSTGVYLYRMHTNEYQSIKKMILMK